MTFSLQQGISSMSRLLEPHGALEVKLQPETAVGEKAAETQDAEGFQGLWYSAPLTSRSMGSQNHWLPLPLFALGDFALQPCPLHLGHDIPLVRGLCWPRWTPR